MGQLEDGELVEGLNHLANQDILKPELKCSEVLCIPQEGSPVCVIQPQVRDWIAAPYVRSPGLHLDCS